MSFDGDARDHRRRGIEVEAATALPIVRAYRGSLVRIRREFDRVIAWIAEEHKAGRKPSRAALERRGDLERALILLEGVLTGFASEARRSVEIGRMAAVGVARESSETLVRSAALRIGLDTSLFVPPAEAVGILDASLAADLPLGKLFSTIAPVTADEAKRTILEGMLSGMNPRSIARELDDVLEVPRTRALTIARTEVLRSFRAASIENYRLHDDVVQGWEWLSALDTRTCVVCWAMHGTIHRLSEPFASHPNCRCSPVPLVGPKLLKPGAEEFAKLGAGDQRAILGPKAFEMYAKGDLAITDLVKRGRSEWGPHLSRRPLYELQPAAKAA